MDRKRERLFEWMDAGMATACAFVLGEGGAGRVGWYRGARLWRPFLVEVG